MLPFLPLLKYRGLLNSGTARPATLFTLLNEGEILFGDIVSWHLGRIFRQTQRNDIDKYLDLANTIAPSHLDGLGYLIEERFAVKE